MTPILDSQAWPELRTAPPNPNTARYEEPRTSDHPNALRTRPSVTWNRFPLSEGQVVSPLLVPPPFSCHGNYGAGAGEGDWTTQLLARLPSMLCFHPVFSLAALQQAGGWGQFCPVTSLQRVHIQGSPPPVPSLQAGGFPAQSSGPGFL